MGVHVLVKSLCFLLQTSHLLGQPSPPPGWPLRGAPPPQTPPCSPASPRDPPRPTPALRSLPPPASLSSGPTLRPRLRSRRVRSLSDPTALTAPASPCNLVRLRLLLRPRSVGRPWAGTLSLSLLPLSLQSCLPPLSDHLCSAPQLPGGSASRLTHRAGSISTWRGLAKSPWRTQSCLQQIGKRLWSQAHQWVLEPHTLGRLARAARRPPPFPEGRSGWGSRLLTAKPVRRTRLPQATLQAKR